MGSPDLVSGFNNDLTPQATITESPAGSGNYTATINITPLGDTYYFRLFRRISGWMRSESFNLAAFRSRLSSPEEGAVKSSRRNRGGAPLGETAIARTSLEGSRRGGLISVRKAGYRTGRPWYGLLVTTNQPRPTDHTQDHTQHRPSSQAFRLPNGSSRQEGWRPLSGSRHSPPCQQQGAL